MTAGAPDLLFLIQRRKGAVWQDVATRMGYDAADAQAKAWTAEHGVEYRVVDDLGKAITPVEFQPLADSEYHAAWKAILQGVHGESEFMAEAGAELRVELRQQSGVRNELEAIFQKDAA